MVAPIIIGAIIALAIAIVLLGMTEPYELIILAVVGAFIVQTMYK